MAPLVNQSRPLRADARRNRERIVEAAREVFAHDGLEAQIDDVAARAKVGVGTVYRHFPTKDALLVALIAARFQSFGVYGRESLDLDDPWEALEGYLRRSAEVMSRDAGVRHALERRPDLLDECPGEMTGLREVNQQVIARALAAGVIRPDATADDIPLVMRSLCSAMGHEGQDWRRLMAIAFDGLRAGAARG
jgi:AcrR family transcriptional regulator